jgi:hypothetical protein
VTDPSVHVPYEIMCHNKEYLDDEHPETPGLTWNFILAVFLILGIPLSKAPKELTKAREIFEIFLTEYLDQARSGLSRNTVLDTLDCFDQQLRHRFGYASRISVVSVIVLFISHR